MRIRSIKPEFWRSDDIAALPLSARLTFIGLWSYVDDNGVGSAKLSSIVADLYAEDMARDPQETLQRVSEDLAAVLKRGMIVQYRADDKDLIYITKWKDHQVVNHPSKGHQYPEPPAETISEAENLLRDSRESRESLLTGAGEQGSRGAGEKDLVAQQAAPPTPKSKKGSRIPDDWQPSSATKAWAVEKYGHYGTEHLTLELEKFTNHWQSSSGQNARKQNWDLAFKNWLHNAKPPLRAVANGHVPTQSTSDRRVAEVQALKRATPTRMELE